MELSATLKILLFFVSVGAIFGVTFLRLIKLGSSSWIQAMGTIVSFLIAGLIVGDLSNVMNGVVVAPVAFSLGAILLILVQVWDPEHQQNITSQSNNRSKGLVSNFSTKASVLLGVLLALMLVLSVDVPELELFALTLPFVCGVIGILLRVSISHPAFGGFMLLFLAIAIGGAYGANLYQASQKNKLNKRAEETASIARQSELLRLASSDSRSDKLLLFQKLYSAAKFLNADNPDEQSDIEMKAFLTKHGTVRGKWQAQLLASRDDQVIIEFQPNGNFELTVSIDSNVGQLAGTFYVSESLLALECGPIGTYFVK